MTNKGKTEAKKAGIIGAFLLAAISPATFAEEDQSESASTTPTFVEGGVLEGEEKLACEAIVCLSSSLGGSISECSPSLNHFYSLKAKKWKNTLKKRKNFLEMCPEGNQTNEMKSLVNAIASGAGRCDAASLNATLTTWQGIGQNGCISNVKPDYCKNLENHEYTRLDKGAVYVVTPQTNNYWPFQSIGGGFMGGTATSNQTNQSCGKWVDQ